MHSTWRLRIPSAFFVVFIMGAAAFAQNQINPGNQIRWPQPACSNAQGAYLPGPNTCTRLDQQPPANILWPAPSCTVASGVYAPGSNQCFDINKISPATQITWPTPACSNTTGIYSPGSNTCYDFAHIPPTQIVWPLPSCSTPLAVYNPATNTCSDLAHIPPSQVAFPSPCVGVYSPSTNTCVPTGTANNPGGAPGDIQMNSGGNFAKANPTDIGKAIDDSTQSYLISNAPPTIGFPWPANSGLSNELIWGSGAAQQMGNYTGLTFTTTATASNGSTSLTVASSGGPNGNPQVMWYQNVTGTGIAPGTIVVGGANPTWTLNNPVTQTLTNSTVVFSPGNTSGLIAIGANACQNCKTNNGSVVIGLGALQNDLGTGSGGEEQNLVVIGPFAGAGETGVNCTYASNTFESVFIGNKVDSDGCGNQASQFIGNHIFRFYGATGVTAIGQEIGSALPTGVHIVANSSVFIGGRILSPFTHTGVIPNGDYTPTNMTCLGWGSCMSAISGANDTVVGSGSFQGRSDNTVVTGHDNFVAGNSIANNVTSASNNVLIGGVGTSGYSNTANSLSTGINNVIIGAGAGGAMTTAAGSTLVGVGAGANQVLNAETAFGQDACRQATGSANVCIGAFAGNALTTGAQNVIIGANNASGSGPSGAATQDTAVGILAGQGETSNGDSYFGYNSGRRNVASLGTNTAVGTGEFFSPAGATGTEQFNAFLGDNSTCVGCTNDISLGHQAQFAASLTHAIQMDTGTNNTSHTMQWQTLNYMDDAGNVSLRTVSARTVPTIASAATIAPTSQLIKVSGTVTVTTITPPTVAQNGGAFLGCISIIPTGVFALATGGNIALASTMVVNRVNEVCYDGTSWYPSY